MRPHALTLLAFFAPLTLAQTPPPQPATEVNSQEASITFSSRVNVVLVPVVVRDRNGKPVDNLTKENFQLFDKGKPQVISRIAIERSDAKVTAPRPTAPATPAPDEPSFNPNVVTPGHFTAWLFDDIHIEIPDLMQARRAAEKYLAEGLKESDRAAIFTTSGLTNVEFTDNVDQLREGLGKIRPHSVSRPIGQQCPDITYYIADLIINKHDPMALTTIEQETYVCLNYGPPQTLKDTESYVMSTSQSVISAGEQETRLALNSLKDLVRRMSGMPGQRLIVLISPGFLRLDEQIQDESDVFDRAIKASVTISALDARGLYTDTPDISKRSLPAAVVTAKQRYDVAASRANSDVMAELADATGGTFFQNNNDLTAGMKELAAVPEVYYILAFSPQNLKLDGGYHSLKVTVHDPPGLTLKARRGYYAPRHLSNADDQAKEEVSDALFSREEMRDIPFEIHTEFFKTTDDEAQLSVNTRIDVRKLRYRKVDGRNGDDLLVVAGLFDRNGNFLQAVSKKVSMRLKDETLASKLNSGIGVHTEFKVAPGRYVLRLVLRDAEGQAMAAQTGGVEIP